MLLTNVTFLLSILNIAALISADQTIGEYFDALRSPHHAHLTERKFLRTETLTEAVWTDGQSTYNISMSRCLTMTDVAGTYTSKDGTRINATLQDITNDLQARAGSEQANRIAYASRVQENAQLAVDAANTFLATAVADYTPTSSASSSNNNHDELRHLLVVPISQYLCLMARTYMLSQMYVAISQQTAKITSWTAGQNLTEVAPPKEYLAAVAIVTGGLTFAQGCWDIATTGGSEPIEYLTAMILNVFLAWFRKAVDIASQALYPTNAPNNRAEAIASQTEVQTAIPGLCDASDASLSFAPQAQLEALGNTCNNKDQPQAALPSGVQEGDS